MEQPLVCLAGPTAAGKSALAMALAQEAGGEIVSVDSMQIWRGLDIGTSKPSPAQRRRIRHHLIDIADLSQSFDAHRFVLHAREAIGSIRRAGRLPVLCGGTGFWFRALLSGLDPLPPRDPERSRQLERVPLEELLEELRSQDPLLHSRIDRKNPRRVIRAVEILRATGVPPSQLRRTWSKPSPQETPLLVLHRSPGELRKRIDARTRSMMEEGLVEETRSLLSRGLRSNPAASLALGYRQAIRHLEGEISLARCLEEIRIATWQYARRQLSWFRKQSPAIWIDLGRAPQEQILDEIRNIVPDPHSPDPGP